MTPSVPELFGAQLLLSLMLWGLFFHRLAVPFGVKALTTVAYATVPLGFAVEGTQSAIYLSDFLSPFLLYGVLTRGFVSRLLSNNCFLWLAALLVVLPVFFGMAYMADDGGATGLGARDVRGDIIWVYRNMTFLLLFGYGLSLRLTVDQFAAFVKMNLVLALVLALIGLLNYFGPVNLAFFDEMNNQFAFEQDYGASRIGAGFMGLFRASVGQWFATIVVLAVGAYGALSPGYRRLSLAVMFLGVGMILLSYSRAGFVGMGVGLVLLGVFGTGARQRFAALGGVAAAAGWLIWQSGALVDRVSTIYTGKSAAGGRIGAWERTLHFFAHDGNALLLGVGPTNRQAVAKIAGTYGAHNEYLDVVYRFGITGLVVLLVVLALLAVHLKRQRRHAPTPRMPLLNMVFAVFLINCVMGLSQEHLLHDYASYTLGVFLYLFYGLAFGVRWTTGEEVAPAQVRQGPVHFKVLQ